MRSMDDFDPHRMSVRIGPSACVGRQPEKHADRYFVHYLRYMYTTVSILDITDDMHGSITLFF